MNRSAVTAFGTLALSLGAYSFAEGQREGADKSRDQGAALFHSDRLQNVRLGQELVDKGCRGEQVALVQRLLNAHGANPQLTVDEKFGPATKAAVIQFQHGHRTPDGRPLDANGVVDKDTLAALETAPVSAAQKDSPTVKSKAQWVQSPKEPLADVIAQIKLLACGDRGEDVRLCKRYLNGAGAQPRLREDDYFSDATQRAVINFQRSWNAERLALPELHLPEDGAIRSRTAQALKEKGDISIVGTVLGKLGSAIDGKLAGGTGPANHETFERALKLILRFEGGISRDTQDRGNKGGNVTNQGITQTTYDRYRKEHQTPQRSVSKMSDGERDQIYYQYYWKASRCDEMPENLAILCFNASVNMGKGASAKLLRATIGIPTGPDFTDATLRAVKEYESASLAESFAAQVELRYRDIAKRGHNEKYLNGWLRRLENTRIAAGIRGTATPMMALTEPLPEESFGPSVSDGIMNIQRELGLPVTGELDSRTEAGLSKMPS